MKQHFLLAEDDENLGTLLTTFLNSKGFQTKWVKNGEEAISYYRSFTNTIDFIILDVMMPKLDGYGVCQEIRKESDVPIIMLTALGDVADRITGLELGADDYVIKERLVCYN